MGEHTNNRTALLASSIPQAMPAGYDIQLSMGTTVEPAQHIVVGQEPSKLVLV